MNHFCFDDARSIDSDAITVKAGTSPPTTTSSSIRPSLRSILPMTKKKSSSSSQSLSQRSLSQRSCASTASRSCTSSPPRIRQCLFWKRREHISRAAQRFYEEEHQVPVVEQHHHHPSKLSSSRRRRQNNRVTLPMKRFLTSPESPTMTMAEF